MLLLFWLFFDCWFFETGPLYIVLAVLEFPLWSRLASNSKNSSYLCPPSAGIKACHLSEPGLQSLFTSGRIQQVYLQLPYRIVSVLFWAASEIFWSVNRPDFASHFVLHLLSLLFWIRVVLEIHVGWQATSIYFCTLCHPALPWSPLSLTSSLRLLSCPMQLGSPFPPFCCNSTQW